MKVGYQCVTRIILIFVVVSLPMEKMKRLCLVFLLSSGFLIAQAPQLSDSAQISVLTCGVGTEIYSTFGHTAFRVQDTVNGIDVVYNYGTFDFDKPNFHLNFAKGKLIYSLSRSSFERFLFVYELEKRWVHEQLLDLDGAQTQQLFAFFEQNYRPENREYLYDPLFNNCSSIVADILKAQFGDAIQFDASHLNNEVSFRQLVRQYLPMNSWDSFGIELAFGAITDKKASALDHMFLPYYAKDQMNNTTLKGKDLVKRERNVLDYPEPDQGGSFMTRPLFWFAFLLCFVVAITIIDWKHEGRNRWLDFSLFFISGLAGILILMLWLATDHVVTHTNMNFLWLFPLNAVVAFHLAKKDGHPKWLPIYLYVVLGGMLLSLLIWLFQFQLQSYLNVFLMLALATRYLFLLKRVS